MATTEEISELLAVLQRLLTRSGVALVRISFRQFGNVLDIINGYVDVRFEVKLIAILCSHYCNRFASICTGFRDTLNLLST